MGDYYTPLCTGCGTFGEDGGVKRAPGGIGGTDHLAHFLIDHLYHGNVEDGTGVMLVPEHQVEQWRERVRRDMVPCPNDTDGDGDCAWCARTTHPGWHPR